MLLLRRCTLSHANNLRKRYGDYYDNRKENERREDHCLDLWKFVRLRHDRTNRVECARVNYANAC